MLTLVPTPIGNLDDISMRALKAFASADIFLCEDTRVTKKLLNLLKERHSLEVTARQFIALHSHNEEEFIKRITPQFFDANVVYVSDAGMPAISDPGSLLVAYSQKHHLEYDVLAGANALIVAVAASGFSQKEFTFRGFLPHKGQARIQALQAALNARELTVFYESPRRLLKLLEAIVRHEPSRQIFLAKELSKMYQHYYRGEALEIFEKIKESSIKGEWVVIVEGVKKSNGSVGLDEIMELGLPKKEKAKLISKITGESIKVVYNRLLQET